MASTATPKQVKDLLNMARESGWRKLDVEIHPGVEPRISIMVHPMSFQNTRALALLFGAELSVDGFSAAYDGRVSLEIAWPWQTHARYRPSTGPSPLFGAGALVKWGSRWREDYLLAQFDERGTRSESGVPLWAGWHDFPSKDFIFDA